MAEIKHAFALCAYKNSEYLEECLKSLVNQTVKSEVIVCTSTPSEYIDNIAAKYGVPVFVRDGKSDIRDDWNFAYNSADADFVTIAHQDDVYEPDYSEKFRETLSKFDIDKVTMFVSGYFPYKSGKKTTDINCKIRAFLRWPLKVKAFAGSKFWRRRALCLGNSICCPGVTYNKKKLGENVFTSEFKFNIDWDTFLKLAEVEGYFAYCKKQLVCYRIHDGATSKEFINNNGRIIEDTAMFNKFWPAWITKIIMVFYKKAYDTYG